MPRLMTADRDSARCAAMRPDFETRALPAWPMTARRAPATRSRP